MTCQTLREAIVDVARGVEIGEGTLAAVECHVEHCASCVALMARERQLSLGLRALAESTSVEGVPEAMGRRLREISLTARSERGCWSTAAGRQPNGSSSASAGRGSRHRRSRCGGRVVEVGEKRRAGEHCRSVCAAIDLSADR